MADAVQHEVFFRLAQICKQQNRATVFEEELLQRQNLLAVAQRTLREQPDVKFRLVGRSVEYKPGVEMVDHLKHMLGSDAKSVEFFRQAFERNLNAFERQRIRLGKRVTRPLGNIPRQIAQRRV